VSANYLPLLISQLQDTSLLPFAIPVLYNICIDYGKLEIIKSVDKLTPIEPAQIQASNSLLGKELIELISSPRYAGSMAFLGYSCKLLGLLISHRRIPQSNVRTVIANFLGSI